jgi:hypothetical protein
MLDIIENLVDIFRTKAMINIWNNKNKGGEDIEGDSTLSLR